MEKFKQNQLNQLEMSMLIGGRTKTTTETTDASGNCLTTTVIDKNDGTIKKIKIQPCE